MASRCEGDQHLRIRTHLYTAHFLEPESEILLDDLIYDYDPENSQGSGQDGNRETFLDPNFTFPDEESTEHLTFPSLTFPGQRNGVHSLGTGISIFDNATEPVGGGPSSCDLQSEIQMDSLSAAGLQTPVTAIHSSDHSMRGPESPSRPPNATCNSHQCGQLAASVLSTLRLEDNFSCMNKHSYNKLNPPDTPPLTWDQALHVNQTAMSTMQHLLRCPCVATDPHLAFLYSSIISKMLFWYQVANRIVRTSKSSQALHSPPASSIPLSSTVSSSGPTPASTSSQSYISSALPTSNPIGIGAFNINAEDGTALVQHLLLCELRKTSKLVEVLLAGQSDMEEEGLNGVTNEDRAPKGVPFEMLGSWLKEELRKTVREVKDSGTSL
ncbi:hypothetical protein MMC20_001981 [Loxospora ochrophaea]|nr:hypothetical protein [Loxospora ochrophaea]